MKWVVTWIYRDIFDDFKHIGELSFVDQYHDKVSLLSSPKWTDSTELQALRNLAEVVEDILGQIASRPEKSRKDEFQAQSWFRLCHAVSGMATDSYRAQYAESSKYFGDRRHRFVIDVSWDPRMEWMEDELRMRAVDFRWHIAQVLRDEVASVWRQMILERGDGCGWWDVEDQEKWYVTADEVEQVLIDEPFYGIVSMGL
jgi:hypothetical protein